MVKVIAPDGSSIRTLYNDKGQAWRLEKYDRNGQLFNIIENLFSITGQVVKSYGPECFRYPADLSLKPKYPEGSRETSLAKCGYSVIEYDDLDRPYLTTDAQGRKVKTLFRTKADNRQIIIKAYGTSLQQNYATYTYSPNGKTASVMDANGNVTTYDYDGHDRLSRLNLPSKNKGTISSPNLPDGSDYERYSYDPNGNLLTKRKRDGKIITMTYDALNRIIKKTPQGQTAVEYRYNRIGLQIEVKFAGSAASIRHHYDSVGRLSSTNDRGRTLSYAYDKASNRTMVKWPDQFYVSYDYDALNRVTAVKEKGSVILGRYDYDTAGRRSSLTLGNGAVTSYDYHDDNALKSLSHNVAGTADDVRWDYGFNKVNQLTKKTLSGGSHLALYKWQPSSKKNDIYQSNGLNQYSNIAGASLSYDKNGNLTGDGIWSYIYNTENMLTSATKQGHLRASFTYDSVGRRSSKTSDTGAMIFLHDGVEEVADYNANGTLLRRYVHGSGVDEYLVMYTGSGTENKSYYHSNHQGSIIALSNQTGSVTEQHNYDSYGNSDDLTGNPFRYTGRRLDPETGLYYYRARYYSPAIGRFLQTDPIGYGDGLNWYAYVGNDPMNTTDSTGTKREVVIEEIIVIAQRAGSNRRNGQRYTPWQQIQRDIYYRTLHNVRKIDRSYSTVEPRSFVPSRKTIRSLKNYLSRLQANQGRFETKEAAASQAKKMGFSLVHGARSKSGELIYKSRKTYISRDLTSHKGGAWKMASSIKNLQSKNTRQGTYNKDLSLRVGD